MSRKEEFTPPVDGAKLMNVKFFRGDKDMIPSAEFAAVAISAFKHLDSVAVGSKKIPSSGRKTVDLRMLAASH
jgi:hypothetical protein